MKATGISRRIDDLGRITIPKEIRRSMHIHIGDPLEFFTEKNMIGLVKQVAEEIGHYGKAVGAILWRLIGYPVAVCDIEKVVYATGKLGKRLTGCRISDDLHKTTAALCSKELTEHVVKPFQPVPAYGERAVCVVPVINNERIVFGSILLMEDPERESPTDSEIKIVLAAASIIGALFDE